MRFNWTPHLIVSSFLVGFPLILQGQSTFSVIKLGTLGGMETLPLGLNDQGQVVGESDPGDGSRHAFLYSNGSMMDLGTLGGRYSSAYAINDSGQIVGVSEFVIGAGAQRGFLVQNGAMIALGSANYYSAAFGINASGQIVGEVSTGDSVHAALFDQGITINLDQNSSLDWGSATAINSSGQIGGYGAKDGAISAFIHSQGAVTSPAGPDHALSLIHAINEQGLAAGQFIGHAALFDLAGNVTDLDTLGGIPTYPYYSEAFGINDLGQVVGSSDTAGHGQHAFLDQNGVMLDLNDLLDVNSGWNLTQATAINNAGQIIGTGTFNGQAAAFLLTPSASPSGTTSVPEPATAATLLLAAPLLLRRRRRSV